MTEMANDELPRHMHEARIVYLSALFDRCRRRFMDAVQLVGADIAQWPDLSEIGVTTRVDLVELLPFWDELCRRYRAERAVVQLGMFDENPSAVEAFSRWIYWKFWPRLVEDDGAVRAVLRATGALPEADRATAGHWLVGHVRGMTIVPQPVALDPENLDRI